MARVVNPFRYWRGVVAATNPNMGDSSTPKFSEDDEHLAAILMDTDGRGFPVLNVAPYRRAAA